MTGKQLSEMLGPAGHVAFVKGGEKNVVHMGEVDAFVGGIS